MPLFDSAELIRADTTRHNRLRTQPPCEISQSGELLSVELETGKAGCFDHMFHVKQKVARTGRCGLLRSKL